MKTELNQTVNILLAFGGSGGKTVAHLMKQMANDPQAARIASDRTYVVLCDTDDGDLEDSRNRIQKAFEESGLSSPPQLEIFRLAEGVDIFQELVSERMRGLSPESKSMIRQYWWFEPTRDGRGERPFSAPTMPENVNRGAAQCPLVSHFLAWDKLPDFERVLEKISAHCKNTLNLENFSVDLFVISSLAGGTGRGSWQALAFKAREYFWQDRNGRRACRPIGFFFDWTCFRSVAAQRPEQAVKLQVNSYTGLSELSMWLRSALPADGTIAMQDAGIAQEKAFWLPSLRAPADRSAAAVDTERYMPEDDEARQGRTPIHRAYVFTDTSRSMKVHTSDQAYELAAAAIYGRLSITETRSADSNEPERACATATSILFVPIARIRLAIQKSANVRRIEQLLHGVSRTDGESEGGKPLTRTEGGSVVPVDSGLQNSIKAATKELDALLGIGSADTFSALAGNPQMNPLNPLSVLAFKVSARGEEAIVNRLNNGDRKDAILGELKRSVAGVGVTVPSAVSSALADLTRRLSGSEAGDAAAASKSKERERQRAAIVQKFVVKEVLRTLDQGIGPAQAMVAALQASVERSKKRIDQVIGAEDQSEAESDKDLLPYFGFFSGIKQSKRDDFRQAVRQRICRAAFPAVARELKSLADAILEDVARIGGILDSTVAVMNIERNRLASESTAMRKECFTELSNGLGRLSEQDRMLDSMKREREQPVSKMIRRLQPVYRAEEFDRIVDDLSNESNAARSAQADLRQFIEGRLNSAHEQRTARNEYEFRTSLEERLRVLLERQSVEFRSLREIYNLEAVLGDLGDAWFKTYKERRSDANWSTTFSREVEALTGYNLEQQFASVGDRATGRGASEDDLRPMTGDELLSRAALKLAAGCDPFIQYTSGGDRRDRATLIVPTSTVPDRSKRYRERIDHLSRESGSFAHVKAVASEDNYFTLVATADLPKVGFANDGWDGWFSEPSDPEVRKWLDWCEDPQGVAPFKTVNGSVGLGYVCPKYVRDAHLSVRRWKPWVKDDRNREQMHRKWVALAYALVGNTWYRTEVRSDWASRYQHFCEVFAKTFGGMPGGDVKAEAPNPDFPAELWTLPLLEEKEGGRGPTFKRRCWTSTAQGLRLTGADPKEFEDVTSSMRKFVNWFDGADSDRAVSAILAEQAIFANKLRKVRDTNDMVHSVTSVQHVEAIRKFLREYVAQWQAAIRDVKGLAAEEREKQVEFLDRFIKFFDSGMPDLNLLEPFDGLRS